MFPNIKYGTCVLYFLGFSGVKNYRSEFCKLDWSPWDVLFNKELIWLILLSFYPKIITFFLRLIG